MNENKLNKIRCVEIKFDITYPDFSSKAQQISSLFKCALVFWCIYRVFSILTFWQNVYITSLFARCHCSLLLLLQHLVRFECTGFVFPPQIPDWFAFCQHNKHILSSNLETFSSLIRSNYKFVCLCMPVCAECIIWYSLIWKVFCYHSLKQS